jgi:hypothetical protein
MIIYDARKFAGYDLVLHTAGSALYNVHSLPQALVSGVLATCFSNIDSVNAWLRDHVQNPNIFYGGFSFIVSLYVRLGCCLCAGWRAACALSRSH